jgi:hypothetical protein
MAITVDASSHAASGAYTWNHTVGTGNNRLLIVTCACWESSTISGVTYGGTALTLLGTHSGGSSRKVAMYYLLNPAQGTAEVAVTGSFPMYYCACGAVSFFGVDTTNPFGAHSGTNGNSSTATITIDSAEGDVCIDILAVVSSVPVTIVCDAAQAEQWNYTASGGTSGRSTGGTSTKGGAVSVTMSWTITATDLRYAMYAASIKPASSGFEVACLPVNVPVIPSASLLIGLAISIINVPVTPGMGNLYSSYRVPCGPVICSLMLDAKTEIDIQASAIISAINISALFMPPQSVVILPMIGSLITISAAPTQFTIQNPVLLYFFTLTGAPDGLADIIIPIESFQARHRSGDPTYLSVVIPGIDYATAIAARPNGEMVIRMSKAMRGVIYHTEEILRVALESVRVDEGSSNKSITLDGHTTKTYTAKTVALEGVTYYSVNGGRKLYRCATPNIYLRPGDTAAYGTDSFTVGLITYYVSTMQQSMEVSEAGA